MLALDMAEDQMTEDEWARAQARWHAAKARRVAWHAKMERTLAPLEERAERLRALAARVARDTPRKD